MTSELIERVARAIFACHFADTADAQAMMQKEWGRQSPLMDMVRNEARAAIAAMQANTAEQAAELAKFKALADTLAGELQQIEVDAMEYYNEWRETGCDQKDAIRFAFGLGEETRKALREYKEARDAS